MNRVELQVGCQVMVKFSSALLFEPKPNRTGFPGPVQVQPELNHTFGLIGSSSERVSTTGTTNVGSAFSTLHTHRLRDHQDHHRSCAYHINCIPFSFFVHFLVSLHHSPLALSKPLSTVPLSTTFLSLYSPDSVLRLWGPHLQCKVDDSGLGCAHADRSSAPGLDLRRACRLSRPGSLVGIHFELICAPS
jgi:hypothetical protein